MPLSYTIFGPNHVIQENVDSALDMGMLEEAEEEAARRPALTLSRDFSEEPPGIIMGYGGIDIREEASEEPPEEEDADFVPTPDGIDTPQVENLASRIYKTWRGPWD